MKIKKGDNVKVLSGADKGKTGKVIQVLFKRDNGLHYVVVEGVRMVKKHLKTRKQGEKGQIIELAGPIAASKVMVIDQASNKPTRIGYKLDGKVKKRISKRSGEFI
jgi:large subunit ribosomal protein L24